MASGRPWRLAAVAAAVFAGWGPAGAGWAQTQRIPADVYLDKVHGGWLGQMIGVTYGAPTEFKIRWPAPGEPHRITWNDRELTLENTRGWFAWPDGAGDQDDCYIELMTLEALERYGIDATSRQIAELWLAYNPPVWCANAEAIQNFRCGIWPPLSGHPAFSRRYESLDAQIEVDLMGLICPGMPNTCERYARRQAEMTNFGEGTYAAVFIAECYSAAFFEQDLETILRTALRKVPGESAYARMVRDVLQWYHARLDWRDARQAFARKHPRWKGLHAVANSACVLIGLLWGGKDYTRTLQIATLCGWDSDCNPATAGGILGTILGAKAIPTKWKAPLKDTYRNSKIDSFPRQISIAKLAARTAAIGEKVIVSAGGRVVVQGGRRIYEVPIEQPTPPVQDRADAKQIRHMRTSVLRQALQTLRSARAGLEAQQEALRRIERIRRVDPSLIDASVFDALACAAKRAHSRIGSQAEALRKKLLEAKGTRPSR